MPRRFKIDMDPANSSTTRYASNATGAAFTLAQTTPGDSLARIVFITNDDARDDTLITVTVVGTDADGRPQTEVIAGPNSSTTTQTTKHFLTVTSVTPVSTIGTNTWDIGIGDDIVSKTYPLNHWSDVAAPALVNTTGTINMDVELTFDPPNRPKEFTWTDQATPTWTNSTNFAAVTAASTFSTLDVGAYAARFRINTYTDTAELQGWISQTESS
jgi:hypothetical protein